ncbi:MAG: AraC family transcriptional regulator [Gammaproteobacteria bacterium]|nr:AraC family transcriptional regulator [Gammaproteobacteria bacterium]MDH5302551.1 AraC family transcriptional regulator [Gammaproteobacteria bacterium]MDH5321030.1 AraC family transcriptional regulator [Gammaproteobacteria bacterium]
MTRRILIGCGISLMLVFGLATAQDVESVSSDASLAASIAAGAEDEASRDKFRSLDQDVQELKKEVLDLNRDLFLLEEELLFPANSQVAFFISMDVGEYFELDSVNLKIDGKEVSNYLYTEREVGALIRGGVHRMHMANLKTGDHELIAIFTGKGPQARDYRRGATLTFSKGIGAKYLELEITDRVVKQQPEFVIKEWE